MFITKEKYPPQNQFQGITEIKPKIQYSPGRGQWNLSTLDIETSKSVSNNQYVLRLIHPTRRTSCGWRGENYKSKTWHSLTSVLLLNNKIRLPFCETNINFATKIFDNFPLIRNNVIYEGVIVKNKCYVSILIVSLDYCNCKCILLHITPQSFYQFIPVSFSMSNKTFSVPSNLMPLLF